MRHVRYLLAIIIVLSGLWAGGIKVQAEEPSDQAIVAAFNSQPTHEAAWALYWQQSARGRIAIDTFNHAVTVVVVHRTNSPQTNSSRHGLQAPLLAAGCFYSEWGIRHLNGSNQFVLSEYSQRIDWCTNGSTIDSVSPQDHCYAYFAGWSCEASVTFAPSGGVGSVSYSLFSKWKVCEWIAGWCRIQHFPWVNQTVWGDGRSTPGSPGPVGDDH